MLGTIPPTSPRSSRRTFLKLMAGSTGLSATGLCFANSDTASKAAQNPDLEFKLFTIHPDNRITVFNTRSEMGQGVMTSLTQLLLEELNADWSQIKEVKNAWADSERFGHQNTIGAISNFIGWNSHRQAGAAVLLLLRQTAAEIWQSDLSNIEAKAGHLSTRKGQKTLSYGQLCELLQGRKLPEKVELKDPQEFKLIGKSMPRLDIADKIEGRTLFGIDQRLPNMKVAVVARCPVFGGTLKSFSAQEALKIKGVASIFAVPSGIAVIAKNYWQANKARAKLDIEWDLGDFENTSSESLLNTFSEQLNETGKVITDIGDAATNLDHDESKFIGNFNFPLAAHMTMEPMNCTVWNRNNECTLWAPTQNPNDARRTAAKALKLDQSKVTVNVTFMGGGFGRRSQDDFVAEACEIAKHVEYPIKVVWSREDDIQHDFYRPLNCQRISAKLVDGKIHAWQHKVATLSTSPYHFSLDQRGQDSGDWVAYGGAEQSLYRIPNFQTQTHLLKSPMSVGILRGISHGYINFACEVSIDELARQAKQDPIDFRLAHIEEKRAREVLRSMQEKIKALNLNSQQSLGIAFGHEKDGDDYQYYNAVAAIVEKNAQKQLKLKKMLFVVDHGQVINPDGLKAQAEGSLVFAQSMMFLNGIQLKQGRIQQSNFHDSPVIRMGDEVAIEVHTIDNHEWPMGTGEKLQGTIQPAIANALARASGKIIRSIPINLNSLAS